MEIVKLINSAITGLSVICMIISIPIAVVLFILAALKNGQELKKALKKKGYLFLLIPPLVLILSLTVYLIIVEMLNL